MSLGRQGQAGIIGRKPDVQMWTWIFCFVAFPVKCQHLLRISMPLDRVGISQSTYLPRSWLPDILDNLYFLNKEQIVWRIIQPGWILVERKIEFLVRNGMNVLKNCSIRYTE